MRTKSKVRAYNHQIEGLLPRRCVLTGGRCTLISEKIRRDSLISRQPYAFIIRPYDDECLDMELKCKKIININYCIARNANTTEGGPQFKDIATILAKDDSTIGSGYCQICSLCLYAYFGVADITYLNPNVFIEIGLMFAFGKPVILTLDIRTTSLHEVPFDLRGLLLVTHRNTHELEIGLKGKVSSVIAELEDKKLL